MTTNVRINHTINLMLESIIHEELEHEKKITKESLVNNLLCEKISEKHRKIHKKYK